MQWSWCSDFELCPELVSAEQSVGEMLMLLLIAGVGQLANMARMEDCKAEMLLLQMKSLNWNLR